MEWFLAPVNSTLLSSIPKAMPESIWLPIIARSGSQGVRSLLSASCVQIHLSSSRSAKMTSIAAPASPSFHSPCARSLMTLAVVERQLIMQGLDFRSLARLSSTCHQMQVESLHKEAGKFIPEPVWPLCVLSDDRPSSSAGRAHASPLFRMHAPVRLSFLKWDWTPMTLAQREALSLKAARFLRINQLSFGRTEKWTEIEALRLLAQPGIQSVTLVESGWSAWPGRSAVLRALFSLPQLTSVNLNLELGVTASVLMVSALSMAPKLRILDLSLSEPSARESLHDVPAASPASPTDRLTPLLCGLPPTLTALTLKSPWQQSSSPPASVIKTMLLALPLLQHLTTRRINVVPLLQGLLDAGTDVLARLCRVEWQESGIDDVSALLPLFLASFPSVIISLQPTYDDDAEHELRQVLEL